MVNIIEVAYKWNGGLSQRPKTDYIALHHAEASKCTPQDIDSWHKGNGWSGIGYHFFVRKDGRIYRGRPLWALGAHVSGMNSVSIGICAEGSYMKETMPQAQKIAIAELLDYLKTNFYPNAKIVGHREIGSSNCPGTNFPLNELKNYKNLINTKKEWADEFFNKLKDKKIIENPEIWKNYKENVKKCESIALLDKATGGRWESEEADSKIHYVQPHVISMMGKKYIEDKDEWLTNPDDPLTAGLLLALIDKITGGVLEKYKKSNDDHWSRKHLNSLCDKGIIDTPSAWSDDFDKNVSRELFMALVCKAIVK